jgi:hypothetical protein
MRVIRRGASITPVRLLLAGALPAMAIGAVLVAATVLLALIPIGTPGVEHDLSLAFPTAMAYEFVLAPFAVIAAALMWLALPLVADRRNRTVRTQSR